MTTQQTADLRHVDPATLTIGANVRTSVDLPKPFVTSLKTHGVLQPIVVTEAEDGALTVRYGQRRTLGAVEAGLPLVPVVVLPADADEAARIVTQMGENDHRDGVTTGDRRAAYEQLAALGLTAAQIARRTGRPKAEVKAAEQANGSDLAKAAADRYTFLTLDDAALIAEFDGEKDTVAAIVAAAKEGRSTEHVAQRARDERAREQALADLTAALEAEGTTIIDRPGYDERTITPLADLRLDAEASDAPEPAQHAQCPGHAAYLRPSYGEQPYQPVYVCTSPKRYGHLKIGYNGQPTTTVGGPMTEEEKAERRRVIEGNKAWDSAATVRREWLTGWMHGTSAVKGVERFIARATIERENSDNAPWEHREALRRKIDKASPRVALRMTAALLLLAWDKRAGRHTWRNPTEQDRRYLTAIIGWGYQPSEIEQGIVDSSD